MRTPAPEQSLIPALDEKSLVAKINSCADQKERFELMTRLAELRRQDAPEKQEQLLEQITQLSEKVFGHTSIEYADSLCRQARLYFQEKELGNSAKKWIAAEEIYELKGDEYNNKVMQCVSGRIAAECANGTCKTETELYKKLLELRRKVLGNTDQQTMIAAMLLAEVYGKTGKDKEALKLFQEVYDWSLTRSPADCSAASLNLARTYIRLNEYKKAEALIRTSLDYAQTHPINGRINPLLISALKVQLFYFQRQKLYKEAVTVAKEILDQNEKQMGPKHPQLGASIMIYANALRDAGRVKEAKVLEKRVELL